MPFYGTDLNAMIDIKSDRAYSNYFDPAKKNIIIREAVIKAIDKKVATNDRIQVQDDLFGIFKRNVVFTPTANAVTLNQGGTGISDYFHAINVQANFQTTLNAYVTKATQATPCVITLSKETAIRTGDAISISGVTGATNANGFRYVKQLSPTVYELYSNAALTVPIVGNGSFSGVSASVIFNQKTFCKNFHPAEKFSQLNRATIESPYYEIASGTLLIYPITYTCSSIEIDYISIPPQILVTDNTTDLLTVYSERFLEFIADETCRLMGMYSRDIELQSNEQSEIIQQP